MAQILPILEKKFYTVSEITKEIKDILEDEFFDVWIVGEVSNIATPISGHTYFTLKDNSATIKAVLFKKQKAIINYNIKNGEEIILRGRISLYEPRGEYQVIVDYLEPYGIGKLFLEIEKLKGKLAKEGLFHKKFKKPIPKYPDKIGIITSITGAAIQDIFNVLNRRYTGIEIYIYPVKVQGENAASLIVEGLNFFNNSKIKLDVIILARGGGSIEDLMPFNNESVARAIFNSKIPVVSAIGHETDFTIADLVADLRAPTPSAAAELVVKNKEEVIIHIDNLTKRLELVIKSKINKYFNRLNHSRMLLNNFIWKINSLRTKINTLQKNLISLYNNYFNSKKELNQYLFLKLMNFNPEMVIEKNKNKIVYLENNLKKNFLTLYKNKKNTLNNLMQSLHYLSPLNVLNRGYAILEKNGKLIKSKKSVNINDKINIRLSDGKFSAIVSEK